MGSATAIDTNYRLGRRLGRLRMCLIWLVIHWLIQPHVADGWAHIA